MKTKLILKLFRIGATVLTYFVLLITLFIAGKFAVTLIDNSENDYISINDDNMQSIFTNLSQKETSQFTYSQDRDARYKEKSPSYAVDVRPNTATGIYYMASTIFFLSLGFCILFTFKRIFTEISLDAPFKLKIVKYLQLLAYLFIGAEVLGFVHYFILGALIKSNFDTQVLHQVSEKGSSLMIGLMILIISVIYKRGLEIYEENRLTV